MVAPHQTSIDDQNQGHDYDYNDEAGRIDEGCISANDFLSQGSKVQANILKPTQLIWVGQLVTVLKNMTWLN